jgi:hypothetical protein
MAVKLDVRELNRRKLRYRLFRIQNGIPVDSEDGLQGYFETQPEFDGWHNFNKTWDVGLEGKWPNGHFSAVALKKSYEERWNEKLLELAQDWPFDQPQESEEVLIEEKDIGE